MAEENHDSLTRLETNQEHIMKKLDKIERTLFYGDGRMREHEEKITQQGSRLHSIETTVTRHVDGHYKFAFLMVGATSAVVAAITLVIKLVL